MLSEYLNDPAKKQGVELLAGHLFGKAVGELDADEAAQIAQRIEAHHAPLTKSLAVMAIRERVAAGDLSALNFGNPTAPPPPPAAPAPQAQQAAPEVQKSLASDLRAGIIAGAILKANSGEGSRGGHVVGHTKSGKPIYGAAHDHYRGLGGGPKGAGKMQKHPTWGHDPGQMAEAGQRMQRTFPDYSAEDHQHAADLHHSHAVMLPDGHDKDHTEMVGMSHQAAANQVKRGIKPGAAPVQKSLAEVGSGLRTALIAGSIVKAMAPGEKCQSCGAEHECGEGGKCNRCGNQFNGGGD